MAALEDAAPAPSRSRGPQFSLRSLLAIMLVAGLLLGRYGLQRLEAARERAALIELRESGADVQFHAGRAVGVSFSGDTFQPDAVDALSRLSHLQRLVLIDTSVNDAGLARVADLSQLEAFLLLGGAITDEGLTHVARLENLRVLRLDNTAIGDRGLERVARLHKLQRLDLVGTRVTDAGLRYLEDLPQLDRVYLHGTRVTDEGVQQLQGKRPDAKIVY